MGDVDIDVGFEAVGFGAGGDERKWVLRIFVLETAGPGGGSVEVAFWISRLEL